MTIEPWVLQPSYTVQNAGPFQISNPYSTGTISVVAISTTDRIELDPSEYTVVPASSDTAGDVYLEPAAAVTYDGMTLVIERNTVPEQGWVGLTAREKGIEAQLDKMTRVDQELLAGQLNVIRADRPINPIVPQEGRALIWENGQIVPGPDAADIAEAAPNAQAAAASALAAAFYDGPWVADVAALMADVVLTYVPDLPGTVVAGDVIRTRAEGFSYQAAAASAADHHVVTAGGVKLYVLPGSEGYSATAFGAVGASDDRVALQNFLTAGGGRISAPHAVGGQLDTVSHLVLAFAPGAVLSPTAYSATGAFLTNVTANTANRAQTDLSFVNPQIDMSGYPDAAEFTITGGTTTTVVLPAGASAVDDFYNGLFLQFATGAQAAQYRQITDYVGSTRTATLASALAGAPSSGDKVLIGWNDNAAGFAWGAKRVSIRGGHIRNLDPLKMVPRAFGGKGVNFEQGVTDGLVDGTVVEDMPIGFFINGTNGTHSTGASKRTVGIRKRDLVARRCGAALVVANLDLASGITGEGDDVQAVIDGLNYEDCGHAPYRIVGSSQEKSGAIALMGATNMIIANVTGYQSAGYPASYPTTYGTEVGFGLTGPVGAAVWGHGRNITLTDHHHYGDFDAAVHIGRCRALGDDAPSSGQVTQALGWRIENLNVHGTVDRVVSRDENLGFDEREVSGYWQIIVDTVTTGFVPTTFELAEYLVLDITERATGKRIIGTPKDILVRGNTFADYPAGTTDLRVLDHRQFTIAVDGVASFKPLLAHGIMEFASASSLLSNLVRYRADATTPQTALFLATANQAVTTGALTGTTGAAGNFTISAHTDGKIYLENQRVGSITVDCWLRHG